MTDAINLVKFLYTTKTPFSIVVNGESLHTYGEMKNEVTVKKEVETTSTPIMEPHKTSTENTKSSLNITNIFDAFKGTISEDMCYIWSKAYINQFLDYWDGVSTTYQAINHTRYIINTSEDHRIKLNTELFNFFKTIGRDKKDVDYVLYKLVINNIDYLKKEYASRKEKSNS